MQGRVIMKKQQQKTECTKVQMSRKKISARSTVLFASWQQAGSLGSLHFNNSWDKFMMVYKVYQMEVKLSSLFPCVFHPVDTFMNKGWLADMLSSLFCVLCCLHVGVFIDHIICSEPAVLQRKSFNKQILPADRGFLEDMIGWCFKKSLTLLHQSCVFIWIFIAHFSHFHSGSKQYFQRVLTKHPNNTKTSYKYIKCA